MKLLSWFTADEALLNFSVVSYAEFAEFGFRDHLTLSVFQIRRLLHRPVCSIEFKSESLFWESFTATTYRKPNEKQRRATDPKISPQLWGMLFKAMATFSVEAGLRVKKCVSSCQDWAKYITSHWSQPAGLNLSQNKCRRRPEVQCEIVSGLPLSCPLQLQC
jgi:hypothetical protein